MSISRKWNYLFLCIVSNSTELRSQYQCSAIYAKEEPWRDHIFLNTNSLLNIFSYYCTAGWHTDCSVGCKSRYSDVVFRPYCKHPDYLRSDKSKSFQTFSSQIQAPPPHTSLHGNGWFCVSCSPVLYCVNNNNRGEKSKKTHKRVSYFHIKSPRLHRSVHFSALQDITYPWIRWWWDC